MPRAECTSAPPSATSASARSSRSPARARRRPPRAGAAGRSRRPRRRARPRRPRAARARPARHVTRGRDLRPRTPGRHPQRGRWARSPARAGTARCTPRRDASRPRRPRRTQAADQQHVCVLLERVQPDERGRVTHRFAALAPCEQRERSLVEDGAGRPATWRRSPSSHISKPGLERNAQPFQQLMAETGKRDGLRPRSPAEDVEVDERPRPKRQAERDRRRAPRQRPGCGAGPRASSAARPADRRPRGRATPPTALARAGPACGRDTRAVPMPSRRGRRRPRCRPAPSAAAPEGGCSAQRRPPVVTRTLKRSTVTLLPVEINNARRESDDAQ